MTKNDIEEWLEERRVVYESASMDYKVKIVDEIISLLDQI